MALVLKRMIHPYEALKCHITGKILAWGDYYYEDDVDGLVVDFNYYYDTKQAMKQEQASYLIEEALTMKEYEIKMKEAEREFLHSTVFERPLRADNLHVTPYIEPRGDR